MEEENALAEEFAASDARPVQDAKDAAENFNDPKWVPDPVDAPPGEFSRFLTCSRGRRVEWSRDGGALTRLYYLAEFRKSKSADIIQLLVSIYDTKDVFIKELQVLLAQRLLAVKDYELDREVSHREQLSTLLCLLEHDC